MLEDFRKPGSEDGKRFGVSLIIAAVAFAVFGASVVAATANVRTSPVEEELVQVELAPPPEPEPPPPPPTPPPEPPAPRPERDHRPAPRREELVQPEEISDAELERSDRELRDDGSDRGGRDGLLGGAGDGAAVAPPPAPPPPPPAPPRPRGPVMRPENAVGGDMLGGMPPIEYPSAARSSGVQGMVIVKCVVNLSGETERCSVLRGHPMLNGAALANVQARRFTPVRLPDGTPIDVWKVFPVRFELTNL